MSQKLEARGIIRVPYPNMPETAFPEVRYTTTIPDIEVLLDITEFLQTIPPPTYFFATLIDKDQKDVIFFARQSHDKVEEALKRDGMIGATFNHAQLGLTETAEIKSLILRNYWGESRGARMQNVVTLLGKVNPKLFTTSRIYIGVSGGGLDFIFDPTTNEIQDFQTELTQRIPQLY